MHGPNAEDTHVVEEGGIGRPVLRKEDRRLLTGAGSYTDDVNFPGQAYAVMVRSPHAHARIGAIETGPALRIPGVLAVFTAADVAAVRPAIHNWTPGHPPDIRLVNRDGSDNYLSPHIPLPRDKVRHVGEAVAMVVGE
ncbi:MAG TPA: xanthine dehydrogenase family protein molybdopterin-binding subunit, partial [Xanthobacteraceae bacterium]